MTEVISLFCAIQDRQTGFKELALALRQAAAANLIVHSLKDWKGREGQCGKGWASLLAL